jgi:hypothetical protein
MIKPGLLTREYFAGRRNAYLPPIRLYLIISVVFFLLPRYHQQTRLAINPSNSIRLRRIDFANGKSRGLSQIFSNRDFERHANE